MRKRWFKVVVIVALILLPVGIWWLYREITKFPEEITIGTGPEGGRYIDIVKALRREIKEKHGACIQNFGLY